MLLESLLAASLAVGADTTLMQGSLASNLVYGHSLPQPVVAAVEARFTAVTP